MNNKILVIGSSNTDMVIKGEKLPTPGETVIGGRFETFAGGKGANQAVAARRAGGDVSLLAAVGDDAFGRQTIANFERDGIDTALLKIVPGVASGIALILIGGDGENMISVAPGANHQLLPEDVARVDFKQFDYVLLQLEIPLATVQAAVDRAKAAGCKVVLNPAPAAHLNDAVLAQVDLLTPNRGELGLLTGCVTDDDAGLEAAAHRLCAKGIQELVVTLGSQGAFYYSVDRARQIPGLCVTAVDTVGAGDCFTGSLVAALSRSFAMPEAIRFATAAAALSVQRMGAQSSYPTQVEIEALLASQHD